MGKVNGFCLIRDVFLAKWDSRKATGTFHFGGKLFIEGRRAKPD